MKHTLYLESIAGIAGDMFSAAFLDAGCVSIEELQTLCAKVGVPNVGLVATKVLRAGMQGTHLDVQFDEHDWEMRFAHSGHAHHGDHHSHFHVPFKKLEQIIQESALDDATKTLACKILRILAEAEAYCHGVSVDTVVFHELGMLDSLMDIVMAAYCISKIQPAKVVASSIRLGRGAIHSAHGLLPVPPPVSAKLILGMPIGKIPTAIAEENIELSTPTGLAILKALNPEFTTAWPSGMPLQQGYGAGSADFKNYSNFFRIAISEEATSFKTEALPYAQDQVIEIVTNFDDITSEQLADVCEKLLKEHHALDVWQTPCVGKKGRVMLMLSLLVNAQHQSDCVNFLLTQTSTLGVRYRSWNRFILERHFKTGARKDGKPIRIKVAQDLHGHYLKEKPEFEDLR